MKKVIAASVCVVLLLVASTVYFNEKAQDARYPKGNFVLEESGFAFSTLPFGSTPDDLAALLEVPMNPPSKRSAPFSLESYETAEKVLVLDALGIVDAQFTEDGLCAFTFTAELNMRDTGRIRQQLLDLYRPAFGTPVIENSPDTVQISLLWEDRKTGTALRLEVSKAQQNTFQLEVCAYEKWRYVEAGAEKWISE